VRETHYFHVIAWRFTPSARTFVIAMLLNCTVCRGSRIYTFVERHFERNRARTNILTWLNAALRFLVFRIRKTTLVYYVCLLCFCVFLCMLITLQLCDIAVLPSHGVFFVAYVWFVNVCYPSSGSSVSLYDTIVMLLKLIVCRGLANLHFCGASLWANRGLNKLF